MISTIRRQLTAAERETVLRSFGMHPRKDLPFIIACCIVGWIGGCLISVLPLIGEKHEVVTAVILLLLNTGAIGGYLFSVLRGEQRRRKEHAVEITALRKREVEEISADLTAGITFAGQEDLGPYWLGSDGERILVLHGQELFDLSPHEADTDRTLFDQAQFTILHDPTTGIIYCLQNQGQKIPVEVVTTMQLNAAYGELMLQHDLPSLAILPGSLDTWQEQLQRYQHT